MLHIHQIKKLYGSFEVLHIAETRLEPGKYWLKGANGSGKSTLLNIVAGILPFKGDITIRHKFSIVKNPVQYRALVNHAPAEPLYPSFVKGQDLIDFYKRVKRGNDKQIEEVKSALAIDDFLKNPTGSYSSGMLKKLSLLLAFIGKPAWILLDEPFTTLDAQSQIALQQLIRQKNDVSFILTSHHDVSPAEIPFTGVFLLKNKTLEPD